MDGGGSLNGMSAVKEHSPSPVGVDRPESCQLIDAKTRTLDHRPGTPGPNLTPLFTAAELSPVDYQISVKSMRSNRD